jgi:hypothetical protein
MIATITGPRGRWAFKKSREEISLATRAMEPVNKSPGNICLAFSIIENISLHDKDLLLLNPPGMTLFFIKPQENPIFPFHNDRDRSSRKKSGPR